MKPKTVIPILIIMFTSQMAMTQRNLLEKFDFEIAINYSTFLNKSKLDSINLHTPISVYEEDNSWHRNYNFSLGFEFSKNYCLRLKYSQYNIYRNINGATYEFGGADGCCFPTFWTNLDDKIRNTSIGLVNELTMNFKKFDLLGTFEITKQRFNRDDTVFYLQGMKTSNYALGYSFGIQKYFLPYLSTIIRAFSTNTIFGKDEYANNSSTGSFIPVSYGIELGCRIGIN